MASYSIGLDSAGTMAVVSALWGTADPKGVFAPLAFRRPVWMRILAVPFALIAGIANGCGHVGTSIYYGRLMPGVYTAPLVLLAGILLLREAIGGRFPAADVRS